MIMKFQHLAYKYLNKLKCGFVPTAETHCKYTVCYLKKNYSDSVQFDLLEGGSKPKLPLLFSGCRSSVTVGMQNIECFIPLRDTVYVNILFLIIFLFFFLTYYSLKPNISTSYIYFWWRKPSENKRKHFRLRLIFFPPNWLTGLIIGQCWCFELHCEQEPFPNEIEKEHSDLKISP